VDQPLFTVVTPFHNTEAYLSQCIESVLAQSYPDFEYILVDNCSTDRSGEIARAYAGRDPRIRFIRRTQLLSQVQNYNAALAELSAASRYCKLLQADDTIFPDCLKLVVQAFSQSESIGLVSSLYLKGDTVRGSDFPPETPVLPGREVAALYLRSGTYVFGSPTTVSYRSSIVRQDAPFYQEGLLHEDTEKCMQILAAWDFGFVYQVLSFLRTSNDSITSRVRSFNPDVLDRYILVKRFASAFLPADEAVALIKEARAQYYGFLAHSAVRFRGSAFWRYHKGGLKTVGEAIDRGLLARTIGLRAIHRALYRRSFADA